RSLRSLAPGMCAIVLTSGGTAGHHLAVVNSGPRPLARRRRDLILELVASHGSVRVSELTDRLGVSDMTVRRDLDALASEGAVHKVHGGATLPAGAPATVGEPGFTAKLAE